MLGQNDRHFTNDIFNCIFLTENCCILIQISLNVIHGVPINNNSAFGLDNGLAPNKRQAFTWTNDGIG